MRVKDIIEDGSIWISGKGYVTEEPIVTVLLPTFRRAKSGLFELAVQSVLKQTLRNIELIIIDDASTDGTFDLIQHFMKADARVSCIRHTYNIGLPAISEYEGYIKAKGNYIAFIFDDNEWQPDYLDKTVCYMEREKIKASYGIVRSYYGESSGDYYVLGKPNDNTMCIGELNITNFIANSGVVLHREVIEEVGLYDPHLTLKRLCDWDLWRRIMVKFRFEGTEIYASCEHGVKLNDSLGNTVRLNSWCSAEQIIKDRNVALQPQNFLEYDIFGANEKSTELFLDNTLHFAEQCNLKHWYNKDDSSLYFLKNTNRKKNKIKRVIVLVNSLDASASLSFERMSLNNQDILFRFIMRDTACINEILYADACICFRNEFGPEVYLKICQELKIPCYFYLDDNYLELRKDFPTDTEVREMASAMSFHNLKKYQAIFVSTKQLLDYCKKNRIHDNLMLLEPIIDEQNIMKKKKDYENKEINIAFMGSKFREETFRSAILPALEKLSKKRIINVYYPSNLKMSDTKEFENSNLHMLAIPITRSLNLALFRFEAKKPDILIHCGPDINNNLYKTENSLINAVQLGAVLVSSKVAPYKEQNNDQPRFLLAENTDLNWYETLLTLIETPGLMDKIYQNALYYCIERYNVHNARKVLSEVINNIESIDYPEIVRRYEDMYSDLFYNLKRFPRNALELKDRKISRSLSNVKLSLSKLISREKSYNIKCNVDNLSEIGLCFAAYGSYMGFVRVSIFKGKQKLREAIMALTEIEMNNWTYFQFEVIPDSMNKIYTISLEFDYEPGSSFVGVYEDATRRTFLYKVMNKLGFHVNGMDALFTDCLELGVI